MSKLRKAKLLLLAETLDAIAHLQPHISVYPSTNFGLVWGGLLYAWKRAKEYNKPANLYKLSLFKTQPTRQPEMTQTIQPTLKP